MHKLAINEYLINRALLMLCLSTAFLLAGWTLSAVLPDNQNTTYVVVITHTINVLMALDVFACFAHLGLRKWRANKIPAATQGVA